MLEDELFEVLCYHSGSVLRLISSTNVSQLGDCMELFGALICGVSEEVPRLWMCSVNRPRSEIAQNSDFVIEVVLSTYFIVSSVEQTFEGVIAFNPLTTKLMTG